MIETLATEQVDFDRFDQGTMALERELMPVALAPELVLDPSASAILTDSPHPWQVPLAAASDVTSAFEQLLSVQLEAKYRPLVLFVDRWIGSREPSCWSSRDSPAELYPALLEDPGRPSLAIGVGARVRGSDTARDTHGEDGARLYFTIGRGDRRRPRADQQRGRVRLTVRSRVVGGGRRHGRDTAMERSPAGMVCDALADFPHDVHFEEAIDARPDSGSGGQRPLGPGAHLGRSGQSAEAARW